MSFALSLQLIRTLEGFEATDDPVPSFGGIVKSFYFAEGFAVWPPPVDSWAEYYRRCYWLRAHCGELPEPADSVAMQAAVNCGQDWLIKAVQRIAGVVPDAAWGPITAQAVAALPRLGLPEKLLAAQQTYYDAQRGDPYYEGWCDRIATVKEWISEGRLGE